MATLSGTLTGQGTGQASGTGQGAGLLPPPARVARKKKNQLYNAYGKLPQWVEGSKTPPKYTDAQKAILSQVFARFGHTMQDHLAAATRRGYRQHYLNIANIANATPSQVKTARAHHALGQSSVAPGPPSLADAMSNGPGVGGSPTPGKPNTTVGTVQAPPGAVFPPPVVPQPPNYLQGLNPGLAAYLKQLGVQGF